MPQDFKKDLKMDDFIVLAPAYITSQLKGAFEIGVLIYLPFFVIDLVTSNILLAMGMMMLSPLTIALPLKTSPNRNDGRVGNGHSRIGTNI